MSRPMSFTTSQRGTPNILSRSTNTIHHQTHPIFPPTPYSFISPVMDDSAARRYEGIQRNRMLQKDLDEARIRAVSREIGRSFGTPIYILWLTCRARFTSCSHVKTSKENEFSLLRLFVILMGSLST